MRMPVSKAKRILLLAVSVLAATALIVGGCFFYRYAVQNIAPSLTLEVGDAYRASDFIIREVPFSITDMGSSKAIAWDRPGQYTVTLKYLGMEYKSQLILADTTAPTLTTQDVACFSFQEVRIGDFVAACSDNTDVRYEYVKAPDMTLEGTQQVQLKAIDLGGNVTVATANLTLTFDREAPVIQGFRDHTVYVGKPVDVHAGISVTDNMDENPSLAIDEGGLNLEKAGVYTVTYTATDAAGNVACKTATVTVIHDTQAPQILGVNRLSIYQGSTVSYRKGVIITDDYDPFPRLSIDSSEVNMEVPGTYRVTYTATNAAGNTASVTTTITIKEKQDSYVDEAVIQAEADKILARIIKDGMTAREKVNAVYNWVTGNNGYISTSDKSDRLQAAHTMIVQGCGDCYNFYAITSLFFDRLGIPYISVERSAQSVRPSRHYWTLVSIDGGQTYYHVDTCPHHPHTLRVCLVTDGQLKLVNDRIPGYYTVDPGIYPATPKEPLD